jgi:hypothetical protein
MRSLYCPTEAKWQGEKLGMLELLLGTSMLLRNDVAIQEEAGHALVVSAVTQANGG